MIFWGGHNDVPTLERGIIPINGHFANQLTGRHSVGPDYDTNKNKPEGQHYTSIAYMLSSKGARFLLQMIENEGFSNRGSPDFMLMKMLDQTKDSYTANPLLVSIALESAPGVGSDTDIWKDASPMAYSPHFQT